MNLFCQGCIFISNSSQAIGTVTIGWGFLTFGEFNRKCLRLPDSCGIFEKLILCTSADSESGAFRRSLKVFWEVGCRRKRKPNGGKDMCVISMKQLLEAGVHFGHQT